MNWISITNENDFYSQYYLLAITKDMSTSGRVRKLQWIARHMPVMNDLALKAHKVA